MIRWTEFRDKYCKHQMAILRFTEDGPAGKACCFKNGKNAINWSDWQECTEENCPALKGGKQ